MRTGCEPLVNHNTPKQPDVFGLQGPGPTRVVNTAPSSVAATPTASSPTSIVLSPTWIVDPRAHTRCRTAEAFLSSSTFGFGLGEGGVTGGGSDSVSFTTAL